MADPRFFTHGGPFTLRQISTAIGCEVTDPDALDREFKDVGPLGAADGATITFLANKRYLPSLSDSAAGAVLMQPQYADRLPEGCVGLLMRDPYYGFAQTAQMFYPEPVPEPLIHERATIADSAKVGRGVRIEAGAVVGEDAVLGDGVWLGPNAVIDRGVVIGKGTWIGAGAYIGCSDLGDHNRIHPGVRIGTRGFGFAMNPKGHLDIPQLGTVKIGSFVEIGANSTVDRGMGPDTVIGDGCKIDNLVQIGHNVRMGRGCVVAAQVGIAGSTVLHDFVACGAQSGIAGHLTISTGAQIAAKAGVIRDIEPGHKVGGLPAVPMRQWLRQHAILSKAASTGKIEKD